MANTLQMRVRERETEREMYFVEDDSGSGGEVFWGFEPLKGFEI